MAGIVGIFGSKATENCVVDMLKSISHRGPDNTHIIKGYNFILGCCELYTSSKQKRAFAGGDKEGIVFDGQIWNTASSFMTDAELISQTYKTYGNNCFPYIDGAFAIAIANEDELVLARDNVGSRPVFYAINDKNIYFASELKSLIPIVKTVYELPPGKIFSSKSGVNDFSMFRPEIPIFGNFKKAKKILRNLLFQAVKKRLNDEAVGGVALSGGLDSSIVAAIALEIDPKQHLFTIGLENSPDVKIAGYMAEQIGVQNRHHIYTITENEIEQSVQKAVWYLESFDEDCISGFIANMFASHLVSQFSKCCICGEGADELFGGYHLLKDIKELDKCKTMMDKLINIAYNTSLRRLDRGWLCNSINYRTPFLDSSIITFSRMIPIEWKIHGSQQTEKWILRETFRDMLPQEVADRKKLRFSGGTKVDDIIDKIALKHTSHEEFENNRITSTNYRLNSPKELWYYKIFKDYFQEDSFEKQVVRWDPFKN